MGTYPLHSSSQLLGYIRLQHKPYIWTRVYVNCRSIQYDVYIRTIQALSIEINTPKIIDKGIIFVSK